MEDSASLLGRLADGLISRYGEHRYDDELTLARDLYCERRGRVFEDDAEWERFSSAFLEWYVTERPWRDTGKVPAMLAAADEEDERHRAGLLAWAHGQRGLALILGLVPGGVEVRDLVGGAHFLVAEERNLAGVDVGDVVEVRLVGFEEQVHFGRTFVYHPA